MRSFIGFGQVPYIGTPYAVSTKLVGIASAAIPLLFQWISYGASSAKQNVNVLVDISLQPCAKMDQIRSVYIDNLGSDNPVYVNFPDTNYTVVAKPNSEGWYPVFTNARQLWVIGEGFLTGDIPQTFLILSNTFMPPAVNVELDNSVPLFKATAAIQRGNTIYSSNLGAPALGDEFIFQAVDVAATNTLQPIFANTPSAGFITVTALQIFLSINSNAGACAIRLNWGSTGVAGTIWSQGFSLSGANQSFNGFVFNMPGQWKFDASQTYFVNTTLNSGAPSGLATFSYSYTVNPN